MILTHLARAHALAGAVALASGSLAVIATKGGTLHRRAGALFFGTIALVCATGVPLSIVRDRPLLLLLSVLSFYCALSGRLALARKMLPLHAPASATHRAPSYVLMVVATIALLYAALRADMLTAAFAVLSLALARSNGATLSRGYTTPSGWLIDHVVGLSTAYIATLTAFVVVNASRLVSGSSIALYAMWLGPTLIGIPIVRRATSSFRAKQARETST